MEARLQKWGNSVGIRIPSSILKSLNLKTNDILEDSQKIKGSVLCEHIRSIDYEARKIEFIEHASDNDLLSVIALTNACIEG